MIVAGAETEAETEEEREIEEDTERAGETETEAETDTDEPRDTSQQLRVETLFSLREAENKVCLFLIPTSRLNTSTVPPPLERKGRLALAIKCCSLARIISENRVAKGVLSR